MRHDVRLNRTATADLLSIISLIAPLAGRDIALAYAARIEARCSSLADFPNRGRRHMGSAEVRSVPFERSAMILYRVRGRSVRILRVLHSGRNIDRIIADLGG